MLKNIRSKNTSAGINAERLGNESVRMQSCRHHHHHSFTQHTSHSCHSTNKDQRNNVRRSLQLQGAHRGSSQAPLHPSWKHSLDAKWKSSWRRVRWCKMPQNGWFISWKILLKWMIWGVPLFLETPIFWSYEHSVSMYHVWCAVKPSLTPSNFSAGKKLARRTRMRSSVSPNSPGWNESGAGTAGTTVAASTSGSTARKTKLHNALIIG